PGDSAAKIVLAPATVKKPGGNFLLLLLLLRSCSCGRLHEVFLKTALETCHRQIVSLRILAKAMGGVALVSNCRAKVEGNDKQKDKDPQHDDQRDAPFVERGGAKPRVF